MMRGNTKSKKRTREIQRAEFILPSLPRGGGERNSGAKRGLTVGSFSPPPIIAASIFPTFKFHPIRDTPRNRAFLNICQGARTIGALELFFL